MNTGTLTQETEILSRLIGPDNPTFSPEVARSILQLQFSDSDAARMNALAGKARAGTLTSDEEEALHGYLLVGAMVDFMHSKARLCLRDAPGGRNG